MAFVAKLRLEEYAQGSLVLSHKSCVRKRIQQLDAIFFVAVNFFKFGLDAVQYFSCLFLTCGAASLQDQREEEKKQDV